MNTEDFSKNSPALFSTFVMSLASAAMVEMGLVEDPFEKKKRVRKDQARQNIDILIMLQKKTLGNLDPNEKELLDKVLVDLKFQFAKL
jgi:hypothetical protein